MNTKSLMVFCLMGIGSSAMADGGGYNQQCESRLRCSSGREIWCRIGPQNTSFDSTCTSNTSNGTVSCVAVSVYDRGGAPIASYGASCQ